MAARLADRVRRTRENADRHAWVRAGIALARRPAAQMEVSGFECVEALTLAGFRVVERAAGSTVLRRASRVVVVPDALVLQQGVLASVLMAADMTEGCFRALLADAPTLTQMQTLEERAPVSESDAEE